MSVTTERRVRASSILADSLYSEQIALEMESVRAGREAYRKVMLAAEKRGDAAALKPVERMLLRWLVPLQQAIEETCRELRAGKMFNGGDVFGPVFLSFRNRERELAVIAMHEALGLLVTSPGGVKFPTIAYAIGRAVIAELHNDRLKEEDKKRPKRERKRQKLLRRWRRLTPGRYNWYAKKELADPYVQKSIYTHTGAALIWLMIGCCSDAKGNEPFRCAFVHEYRRGRGKRPAYISLSRETEQQIADGHDLRAQLRPVYDWMIMPPFEWTSEQDGGYVRIRTPFISKVTKGQKALCEAAEMEQTFEGVNALGSVAWRINLPILKVQKEHWQSGAGSLLYPRVTDDPYPPRPQGYKDDPVLKEAHRAECRSIYRANLGRQADRRTSGYLLDSAQRHATRTAIYSPHQIDFRGRAYPLPPYLNHHCDDRSRGLLQCGTARPMDDRAWRWLKIHAANCYGIDKATYDERVAWTDANMDAIKESAKDPRCDFWRHADESEAGYDGKPWQFLSACLALADERIAERTPVQLDGTCNGLQHYAAALLDPVGGASVNLLPSARPADIYSAVAVTARPVLEEMVRSYAPGGDEMMQLFVCKKPTEEQSKRMNQLAMSSREVAEMALAVLSRRTVKQPVMTTVYGVTPVGGRKQVQSKISKDSDILGQQRLKYYAAMMIANLALKGARAACPAAAAAMDWLTECAKMIARAGRTVQWTTPLGFPVEQHYRNWPKVSVHTVVQRVRVIVNDERVPVSIRRQTKSFAPNYVHSLDAAHMMRTAIRCRREGVWFAMVHDSYWTHAADTDRLARILREEFIALHEQPQLQVLHTELQRLHADLKLPDPPACGDLDLNQVLESEYFFS